MAQSQIQQNYISIDGIVTQDLNSIITELENDFKSIYGENINLESNTADGQWLNILAQQKMDALDFQVQLYNNLDVDSVVGLPQQILYKLNGLTIKDFTYSWVYVNVYVSQNVSLSGLDDDIENIDGTGYTVTDINGNNWILAESISLISSETPYLLLFRSQELGQITALADTITTMSTIVAGVTEVNNPANNFITGQTGETVTEFRTRRNRSLQAPSQGFKESIEGQLLALNDVSDAKVYDNKDDKNIDGVQVIVQGGTLNEIGNIIYNNLPPGINTQGAYQATITVNNRNKVFNYNKPNPIPILVKGTIESLTGYPNDIDLNYVKRTLASQQFNIGEIAESAKVTTELKNILGETGSPYDIELSLGATAGAWTETVSIDGEKYNDILFDGTNYVAVGDNGKVAKSTDLTTWTTQTVGTSSIKWVSIAYGNSTYAIVSSTGERAKSTDLTTWTYQSSAISLNGRSVNILTDISYFNNKFILSGYIQAGTFINYPIIISTVDFSTYISLYPAEGDYLNSYSHYYNSISADNKYIFVGGYNNKGEILVTSDLDTFNRYQITSEKLNDITYNDGNYVVVGDDGCIATSTDLLSWNTQTVGTNNWNSINYLNGLYIAVGDDGCVAMSEDLSHWTISTVGSSDWNNIINDANQFVNIGNGVTTYTLPSTDWQEILTPTGLADFYVMTVNGMDNLTVLGAE